MRTLPTILLLFIYSVSFAGNADTTGLMRSVYQLNNALLQRDSISLKHLLHDNVQYGHSNGWIEKKREVIDDLFNGKLVYNKLDQSNITVVAEERTACVRSNVSIDVTLNDKTIVMNLHVLQVWIKEKKDWILLSRQSIKSN